MPLLNLRVARTLEELNDINYELRYTPGKHNVIPDVLSRAPVGKILEDSESPMINEILLRFTEVRMPGGGDSLFQAFSIWLCSSREQHHTLRTEVTR